MSHCESCAREGAAFERKRIIALLETTYARDNGNFDSINEQVYKVIALIKGESAQTSIETPQKL